MKWLYKQRDLTTVDFIDVEKEFNVTLPDDYKKLIKEINGGALPSAYLIIDGYDEVSYSRNVPLNREAKANIFDIGKYIMDNKNYLFPVANDGFGNYFCLNLKNNTVVFLDHETGKEFYVCDTFAELLKLIKVD